jgi:hypothetical protein
MTISNLAQSALTWIMVVRFEVAQGSKSILRRYLWSLQGDAIVFKDIIVNLGAGKNGKIVGDYAISVASRLEAHITGIAIAFVPDIQAAGTALIPSKKSTLDQSCSPPLKADCRLRY